MIKYLKVFKKEYLTKIISFIVLEMFLISFAINPAYANNDQQRQVQINLYYSFDETNNILKLRWNKSGNDSEKYYVFMKKNIKDKYQLISGKDGITDDFYITTLNDNKDIYYLVCTTDHIAKLPDSIHIFSIFDYGEMVGMYKTLRKCVYTESNEVFVKLDNNYSEDLYKYVNKINTNNINNNLANNNIDKNIQNKDNIIDKEINAVNKDDTINKDESINKEELKDKDQTNVVADNKGNNIKREVEGFFTINNFKPTIVEYKGLRLEIPEGSSQIDSYVFIKTLTNKELKKTPGDSPNITSVDDSGKFAGYEITLNSDSTKRFSTEIKIGMKYDENQAVKYASENNAFIYYYDERFKSWENLKRVSLDKKNNMITCETNHFCQLYTGLMTVQGEPPQSKGINTKPINIQQVDPMAGIRGLPELIPNNKGTAVTGYPITVPEGINNLTPNVSINYSSEAKEGNCGYG